MRQPPRGDTLLDQVRRTIAAHHLLTSGQRVIVAVSGGPDSVALFHLLVHLRQRLALSLHVAHLDHGLRDESGGDAAFVQSLAAQWKVPATIERRDVGTICSQEGWSLEDGARRIRYQFLLETARRQSADRVALAHTADDQAETILMRLVQGTGLLGLGAIPIMRRLDDDTWIIRPFLSVWRREILAYLKAEGLSFRTDATNDDTRFVRNRIRQELLPLLEQAYNPNVKGALAQLAEQSRTDYAFLEAAADRQWKRVAKSTSPSAVTISIDAFLRQPQPIQRLLVRKAVQSVRGDLGRFEFRHWLEAERLFQERPVGTRLDLPGGVRFIRDRARVLCERTPLNPQLILPD